MEKNIKQKPPAPRMNPYIFTMLLLGFGLWCFWDGWITKDPEMLEHATINRVVSAVLLPWAIWDFYKLQKNKKKSSDKE